MGEGGAGTDHDGAVRLQGNALQLFDSVDTHQGTPGQLTLANLDQHIAAAGNHHCIGIIFQGADGIRNIHCLIIFLNIIHDKTPPFLYESGCFEVGHHLLRVHGQTVHRHSGCI